MARVLTLNLGSSSLKASVVEQSGDIYRNPPEPLWSENRKLQFESNFSQTLKEVSAQLPQGIEKVVHRVVHGGAHFSSPVEITEEVKSRIREFSKFAPLHNPRALELIYASEQVFHWPQYAAFDTAFFASMDEVSTTYALPKTLRDEGIRRYGFHGLSHGYALKRATALLGTVPERLMVLHLGNGCSISSIHNGKPIHCTMGFTPLEGLMMGTRSGSIDPGIVLHLCKSRPVEEVDRLLESESGLKGVSEKTSDMQEISAVAEQGDEKCKLALELFIRSLLMHVGSSYALLGGVDVVVFTGGIGTNSSEVRDALLKRAKFLPQILVAESDGKYSSNCSLIVEAREDLEMIPT